MTTSNENLINAPVSSANPTFNLCGESCGIWWCCENSGAPITEGEVGW